MPSSPVSAKQRAFCQEYLLDCNGTQAAIRAGYSRRSAKVTASRMLAHANVRAYLSELQSALAARMGIAADDIMRIWWLIATADPNDLISYRIGPCRYCHGIDHRHQWRTTCELECAQAAFDMANAKGSAAPAWMRPDDRGGFGYRLTAAPNPTCPMCNGLGLGRVVIQDTTLLSPQAALLYNGLRVTRGGHVEIRLANREKALEHVARRLGLMQPMPASAAGDPLTELLRDIAARGSAAPIATGMDHGDY